LWLFLPLAVFAVGFAAFGPANRPIDQDSPAIGKPAPQLDLVLLGDETGLNHLQSLPDGKVTLLHFWGTWCGPCKMEYPELSRMANQLESKDSDFQFLPVSCESNTNETFEGLRAKTEDYFSSASVKSISYCDPQGVTRLSTAERLDRNMMFYPTSIVIGTDGRIAGVWEGYAPEAIGEMREIISHLTASK
jgi:thiol-disulfide isomerase/thioredoxin